ncbi:hypothetical protein KDU71_17520 [Carboxylicivirga sediminis]|uniref:Uncharacterized protein n=1 Tax=Carboxylicivirga sediminis TaxID=2006564 RepID=A0A941F5T5_9BACT|nr:hypothetical protein [Carboxylicivirga sediminis]MBR8537371.1 hypothetical protein [Carboxylicivirga sediminis]
MQNLIERGDYCAPEMDLLLQAYLFLRQGSHYAKSTLITDFQSFETMFRLGRKELSLKKKEVLVWYETLSASWKIEFGEVKALPAKVDDEHVSLPIHIHAEQQCTL